MLLGQCIASEEYQSGYQGEGGVYHFPHIPEFYTEDKTKSVPRMN